MPWRLGRAAQVEGTVGRTEMREFGRQCQLSCRRSLWCWVNQWSAVLVLEAWSGCGTDGRYCSGFVITHIIRDTGGNVGTGAAGAGVVRVLLEAS